MTREEKNQVIAEISQVLADRNVIYLTDATGMNSEETTGFRRECYKRGISVRVVKNALLRKAMERTESKNFEELYGSLKGQTALLVAEVGNAPAKVIKDFSKKSDKLVLKAAYIDEACFVGAGQLDALVSLKSREELIGEVVGLLQSPAKNVISALKSGGQTIAGLVKALEERAA